MTIVRTGATALSVAGAALGLGIGLTAPAGAATITTAVSGTPAASGASAAVPVIISSCGTGGTPVTRPRQYTLSCDSSDILIGLRWTSWTAKGASGHGTDSLNDCIPDCANGKFRNYPVHVSLWGTTAVPGHHGERRYTHYTLTYTKAVPPGSGRTRSGMF